MLGLWGLEFVQLHRVRGHWDRFRVLDERVPPLRPPRPDLCAPPTVIYGDYDVDASALSCVSRKGCRGDAGRGDCSQAVIDCV
jgi:hypothetical protein